MNPSNPASNDSLRLEALRQYDVLDSLPEQAFDDLTELAARICETPISLISLLDDQRQWFKSAIGVSLRQSPRETSFCNQAILQKDIFVVQDAAADERFSDNPLVTGEPGIRFYAGTPLRNPAGHALGTLCVIDRVARQLTRQQMDALQVLGRQVMSQLELRRQTRRLAEGEQLLRRDLEERKLTEAALRESEARLSHALDATLDGLWDWNIETGAVHFSPQWARLLGYAPDEVPQRVEFFFTVLHPDDISRVQQVLEDHLQGRTPVKQDEVRLRHKSGHYLWFLDRGKVAERDSAGRPLRMVGTITDITTRRQLEEQLRQSRQLEAIGQLAGGVAHDFNNILAAIMGNAELGLADTSPDHPAHESLLGIRAASNRARSLVQQILAFSRQQPQERRVMALGPVLRETVRFMRATIPATVDLQVQITDSAPPVLADPTQIHQVLVNLVTNAWHAMEDEPGQIEVRLEPVALDALDAARLAGVRPGRFTRLSVRDSGKGMTAETLGRIFDPYFTTKDPGRGSGLGLSVVHGIVQGHDGTIEVVSQPAQGSTFTIYLPAADAPESPTRPDAPQPAMGHGRRILYVDDEVTLLDVARRMLERLGYRFSGFTRPVDAMQLLQQSPGSFDVLITDMNMPGTTGVQLARQVLALRPDMPVILYSGRVTDDLREQARRVGIREVLHKPNTAGEFSDAINRVTQQPLHVV